MERKTTAAEAVVFLADGTPCAVPAAILPENVGVGDRLIVERERSGEISRLSIRRDAAATRSAQRRVEARLDRLRRGDPGGNVAL